MGQNDQLRSLEAERAVLSGILNGLGDLDEMGSLLIPEYFSGPNEKIFRLVLEIHRKGRSPDLVELSNHLPAKDYDRLSRLLERSFSSTSLEQHIDTVRSLGLRRQLMDTCLQIRDQACNKSQDISSVIDKAQALINDLRPSAGNAAVQVKSILCEIFDDLEKGSPPEGIPTGFAVLDRLMSGLQPTNLITLGARPRMGKTALVTRLMFNIARQGFPVALFSLEMSREQIVTRQLAQVAHFPFMRLRNREVQQSDWSLLQAAAERLYAISQVIDDTPSLSILELKSRARLLVKKFEVKVIFVDYLSKIKPSARGETRDLEVTQIATELKALARELNMPVVCLAQLNRQCEQRSNKRPQLSDLRESGGIEQESDDVLLLYRDEVYNQRDDSPLRGLAEVHIAKQRNGPEGIVNLSFLGHCMSFEPQEAGHE